MLVFIFFYYYFIFSNLLLYLKKNYDKIKEINGSKHINIDVVLNNSYIKLYITKSYMFYFISQITMN